MLFCTSDLCWVVVWAVIGSILGFFSIRNRIEWDNCKRIKQLLLSIIVGTFFALPTYVILVEEKELSNRLSILLAGTLAFGITDIVISLWQKFKESLANGFDKLITNMIDKLTVLINKNKKDN